MGANERARQAGSTVTILNHQLDHDFRTQKRGLGSSAFIHKINKKDPPL